MLRDGTDDGHSLDDEGRSKQAARGLPEWHLYRAGRFETIRSLRFRAIQSVMRIY